MENREQQFDSFTPDQVQQITFKLAMENNAMLRILIANQIKIMDRLGISIDMPHSSYSDLLPGANTDDNRVQLFFTLAEKISILIQKRSKDWIQFQSPTND